MLHRELPRRFHLRRIEDVHGVSGNGVVAEGVQFNSGQCVLTWLTFLTSVTIFPSADTLEKIHGHDGKTILIWDDPPHEKADDDADDKPLNGMARTLHQ